MTTATQTVVDTLNSLLRGQLAAVETYEQALLKFAGRPEVDTIRTINDEHEQAVSLLTSHVIQHGGEPSTGSGIWGYFATAVEGTAKVFGPGTALAALKRGEQHGVEIYSDALQMPELPEDCRTIILDRLLPKCREHITILDSMMAKIS